MTLNDKNKTIATALALVFGAAGLHRFYLHGLRDRWGWLHVCASAFSLALIVARPNEPWLFCAGLLIISMLSGCLEALVLGLTPDERWNARYQPHTPSQSHWPLALLLVVGMAAGATGLIATIARLFDLLFTGGAYG